MTVLRRLKRAVFGRRPRLRPDPGWASLEQVFQAPPITEDYVAAIRLIAPPCDYEPTQSYRTEWELLQNASCWAEYQILGPVLQAMPKPRRVLEIGPGLGRSLVYFSKKLGWNDTVLHAYEGDGTTTRYTKLGPRFEDSFCGNIGLLKQTLAFNGLTDVAVHDANAVALGDLGETFDVIYSFYSVGFHWSLEHFLDDVLKLLADDGTAAFIVPPTFREFPALQPLHVRRIVINPAEPDANRRNSLLIVRRHAFPDE